MSLRIRTLQDIDPLSVPLPAGTQVVTRVDREWQQGRIPAGAVGRIVSSEADRVLVRVVGVGEVGFARHEVLPRKAEAVVRSMRHADAWLRLNPCMVLSTIVGSHAWGLAGDTSDTDRRGVFALPHAWTTGLFEPPHDIASPDGTTAAWETRKAVTQALRADPGTLEMLFLPTASATDDLGTWLLDARHAFVSRAIHGSFGRYALSQLRRLEQSARLADHRGLVLGWLRQDPDLTLDATASRLAQSTLPESMPRPDRLLRAKEYLKQLYRSLHDQGLVSDRSFPGLVRFAQQPAALETPRELRPKNAYNLLRLIRLATDWLRDGEPVFEATGAFRDRLLDVKQGRIDLADVIAEAEAMTPALEEARRATRLPEAPDLAAADALLRRMGAEIARRSVLRVAGPFGVAAPEPLGPEPGQAESDE